MERPEFNEIKDYDVELNNVIKAYLSGEKILPEKRRIKRTKATIKELTLDTGLIECGFTFGNRFREFYAEQTGVRPFKFNVGIKEHMSNMINQHFNGISL